MTLFSGFFTFFFVIIGVIEIFRKSILRWHWYIRRTYIALLLLCNRYEVQTFEGQTSAVSVVVQWPFWILKAAKKILANFSVSRKNFVKMISMKSISRKISWNRKSSHFLIQTGPLWTLAIGLPYSLFLTIALKEKN